MFDLNEFAIEGARQRDRIRGVALGVYRNAAAPFEDTRWLSHWLNRPLSDRAGQRYKYEMREAFPNVLPPKPSCLIS